MDVVERFYRALNHEEVYPVPVVLWNLAPWMPSMFNVNCKDYYLNPDTKLAVYNKLQETFPEVLFAPGIFPDYGVIGEASAFGSRIQWMDDDAPFAHACLNEANDILNLKSINPYEDGLMPKILDEWKYLRKNANPKILQEYGYIEGQAFTVGPVETAGMLRGYDKFFTDFFLNTKLVHKLLDIVTEGIISWIKAQEKINGTLTKLYVVDHMGTQLSPPHFEEFFAPYLKRIYQEFSYVEVRMWHNEGRSSHVYEKLSDIGFNLYHFGADPVADIKKAVGDKISLMGNLDPVKIVQRKTPAEIYEIALKSISEGAAGGGFLLSGGGGLSPNTRIENVRAIVNAAMDYKGK